MGWDELSESVGNDIPLIILGYMLMSCYVSFALGTCHERCN